MPRRFAAIVWNCERNCLMVRSGIRRLVGCNSFPERVTLTFRTPDAVLAIAALPLSRNTARLRTCYALGTAIQYCLLTTRRPPRTAPRGGTQGNPFRRSVPAVLGTHIARHRAARQPA